MTDFSALDQKLSITRPLDPKPKPRIPTPVADSWEEAADSPSPSSSVSLSPPQTPASASLPQAPPPTPITSFHPSSSRAHDLSGLQFPAGSATRQAPPKEGGSQSNHRPEKQVAVAGRLIAGALGVKAPPKSEEARAYERAVREKEKKRLAREREGTRMEVEEAERAKRDIWEG